jgi:hypothetical protein
MRRTQGMVRAGWALPMGLCLLAILAGGLATAHDLDKRDNNSPEVSKWVVGLHNGNGVGCCATADGWKPELVEWDTTKKGYRVMIEGHWVDVPDNAVITGPNKLGHAEVWYYHIDGLPAVRCFLPGEGM